VNILLLCFEYPPLGGGGGVGAKQYAEAWVGKGHQVSVLTSWAGGLATRETVNGVEVIRVLTVGRKDRATSTFLSMLCYNAMGLVYLLGHRKALKTFDVINTHFSIPTGPLAAVMAKVLGLRNVLTIIGGDLYDPSKKSSPHRNVLLRLVNRWVINAADRVVAISSDTKNRAEQYYNIQRSIDVINYGFIPSLPQKGSQTEFSPEPGKFYLIGVGRLVKRKGFDYLIHAMKQLPQEIILLIVGDGPLEASLNGLIEREGVSGRVQLLGFQTREHIYHLLRQADCFVLPSLHEGLGIVVQEAMEAGLPVVATDNGGQVDLIRNPRNGRLVPIEDSTALANAIKDLYHNQALARGMGENNRVDIQGLHMDHNGQLYLDVFEKMIDTKDFSHSMEAA